MLYYLIKEVLEGLCLRSCINTTQDLIADLEFIRKKFNIKKWSIVGGVGVQP